MKNSKPIKFYEHSRWFAGALQNENYHLFILDVSGQTVGSIRVTFEDDGFYHLSYMVEPEFQGNGYATYMLSQIQEKFSPLLASIHIKNMASITVCEKRGFDRKGAYKDQVIYTFEK